MKKFYVWCLFVALGLGISAGRLQSQTVTASLKGTVTDASGAVVPGATVTIHNVATGAERTVTSDSAGLFVTPLLPIGSYNVTVRAKGFRTYTEAGVVLNVGAQRSLIITLQPGTVMQTVQVSASTVAVQTTSAAQSGTITGRQIRSLALNNRNFEQLVTLQPGVSSTQGATVGFGLNNVTAVAINGTRPSASNWTVDGADVNDSGSNFTLLNVPSVDAIREFTLERGTYDAEYGRSGGGQIMVETRSGTNQFHGTGYEFVRNDKLNANDFFANRANAKRPPLRYNDFGYTVGGPIVKNKTFFFFSQEFRRNSLPGTDTFYIPNPKELKGDFSGITTLNPASAPAGCITNGPDGQPDQLSPNCFSNNAAVYIKNSYAKFTPNGGDSGPGSSCTSSTAICSYTTPINSTNNYRQEIARVDQNIGNKIQLFGRYMDDSTPTTYPLGIWGGSNLPGISNSDVNSLGRNFVIHMTEEFSPTVVNELAFNYSWGGINIVNVGASASMSNFPGMAFTGMPYTDAYNRVPTVYISGFTDPNGGSNAPYHERNVDKELYDNLSIIHGNHSIHTGISAQWMTKTENSSAGNGGYAFYGSNGNSPFASFLLGQSYDFSQASRDIIPYLNFVNTEAYVQDDWKITPRLTLNLGVRYSYFPTPHDKNGILDNFDPLVFNQLATVGLINPATGLFAKGTPSGYINGIIVGGANSPYGQQVNPSYKTGLAPRLGFAYDVFGNGKTAIRGGYGMFYDRSLNGIWEQNQFADPPFVNSIFELNPGNNDLLDNPSAGTAVVGLSPHNLHATGNPAFKVPYVQDWNFSIEQQLSSNTVFQIAYVGSNGTHLLGEMDINQVPLRARFANPAYNVNAIRPYRGYGAINSIVPEFNSNYHSLQVSLNRRMSAGLNLGVAYTWSRALTNNTSDRSSPIYDTYNPGLDYGLANFNRSQVLIFNYVYDLPFYRNQRGAVGHVLGGWEISGINTFETGTPFGLHQNLDPFNCYDWGGCSNPRPGTFPGGIGIDPSAVSPRPDQVYGNPIPVSGQTIDEWFNPKAFANAVGHFGTSGANIIVGPGLVNWDFSLLKSIQLTERLHAQLHGDFFNILNHMNPNNPATYIDYASAGHIYSDYEPRTVQLGLKLNF